MDPVMKLSNIIDVSLEENSLETLNEYLSSLKNSPELINGRLIELLFKILKKSAKYEKKSLHVSCVVTCLQHFINTVGTDPQKWVKVSEGLSRLCELTFVMSSNFIKDDALIQRVVNVISAIVDSINNVADTLLKFLVKNLLASSLCMKHTKYTRLLMMILSASLLQKSSRGIRTEILPSIIDQLNDLSNFLSESDDYETQVSVVEILARSLIFIKQKEQSSLFTKNPKIGEIFQKYKPFLNFDPDCRLFLNEVNTSLGSQQKVFSVPCMVVCADNARLKKPNDPAYSDFWVDFNLGSRSISFYYQLSSSESWELMTIPENEVVSAVAKESACQSRSGEKIEAVKFEFTISNSDLTPNLEIPQHLKIYPRKEEFLKVEPAICQIFNEKYQTEVVHCGKTKEHTVGDKSCEDNHKEIGTRKEKSYLDMSTLSKVTEHEEKEGQKALGKSNSQSSQESEESDEEESVDGSPYSRFVKEKMLEEHENDVTNCFQEAKEEEARNKFEEPNTNRGLPLPEFNKTPKEEICSKFVESKNSCISENICQENKRSSFTGGRSSSVKSVEINSISANQRNLSANDSKSETDKRKERENNSDFKSNSKKKRLYSFERSNAEDIVMSSQDQMLSVEIPSYKLRKKETVIKPVRNVNRKNISFSYIANKENGKSAIYTEKEPQNQLDFEEAPEMQEVPLCENDSSECDSESSPHQIFKDLTTKPKVSSIITSKNKIFYHKTPEKEVDSNKTPQPKSLYSDVGSPETREHFKCNRTYGRSKPKRTWKRLRALPIESSDSDPQYVPPTKLLKENSEQINKKLPKKTRFAARIVKDKVDPIREHVLTPEMKLETASDFREPEENTRDIVPESLLTKGKVAQKKPVKVVQGKNTGGGKKIATRQIIQKDNDKNKKKPVPKKRKQHILEKPNEEMAACLDIVHYEPPKDSPLYSEDLALDLLMDEDQQKTVLLNATFKTNDMMRFGKLIMKQVQEKLEATEKLAQKEREMNFATFDYKVQASCSSLYGNSKRVESVTDKLEKLRAMLQTTYNLQKEIAAQISSEASNIEEAKNELLKNINKIEKTESSSITSIFQGFGGYLKRLLPSFIQGNAPKNALTN